MAVLNWLTFGGADQAGVNIGTGIGGDNPTITDTIDGVQITATGETLSVGSRTEIRNFLHYTDGGDPVAFDNVSMLKVYSGNVDDNTVGDEFEVERVTIEFGDQSQPDFPLAENVTFRLYGIGGDGVVPLDNVEVIVRDAQGNILPYEVGSPELGSGVVIDGGNPNEYEGDAGTNSVQTAAGSVLFEVDGTVASIEIVYTQSEESTVVVTPFIGVSDIHFDPVLPEVDHFRFPSEAIDDDPDDHRDDEFGTSGDDSIATGDDADTISSFGGEDTIDGGWDDDIISSGDGADSVIGGRGNDSITGGSGNDTIDAGGDPDDDYYSDHEGPGSVPDDQKFVPGGIEGFFSDPNPDDDKDTVFGGSGNDSIITGDDADSISGGGDDDYIDGGIDDDTIQGDDGRDTIVGGHGADSIEGGFGADLIYASYDDLSDPTNLLYANVTDDTDPLVDNDTDIVFGGGGADTIYGGDDDDTLHGGSGEDRLYGGIDEDEIYGDGGRDTITGGQGADTIFGGTDDDYIWGVTAGDVIDGDEDGDGLDIDTLDLTGDQTGGFPGLETNVEKLAVENLLIPDLDNPGGFIRIDFDDVDIEKGTVEFLDDTLTVLGTATFDNIEKLIIPCFTPGTRIATPRGELNVEDLLVGDRVITRDNGIQEIRWIGHRTMTAAELEMKHHLRPVLIKKGALGDGLPERDMKVSPNHRMLVANEKTVFYFEEREVLVAAKHLVGMPGVEWAEHEEVTYIHFMFNNHEIVLSDGAWSESFQPGDYSLQGIGNAQRQEILELFPELARPEGVAAYHAARRSLKKFEAQLLIQ